MKDATLKQAAKTLNLIAKSGLSSERLQKLFPYFSDLLRADVDVMNRNDFRKACGLRPVKQKKASDLLTVDYAIKPSLVNLVVESHPTGTGIVAIDLKKINRVSMLRLGENLIIGHEYLRRIKEYGRDVCDVRVMEEFLKNPEKIPEEWKVGRTYFWGTIFRSGDKLCVAYLFWLDGKWRWSYNDLDFRWVAKGRVAVFESK